MNARRLHLPLLLALALALASVSSAEVATHGDDGAPDRSIVVLEINSVTEGDDPIQSWAPQTAPAPRVHVLNPGGDANGDGRPSIALHPISRMPVVAWPRRTAEGFDIVVSCFVRGAWTEPQVVVAGDSGTSDAHLTVDPVSGDVHLFYRTGGDAPRVEHRQAAADAVGWSAPTLVSAADEIAARPSATWHAGRLVVAYEVHLGALGSASRQIVIAERDGDMWVSEVVSGSGYDGPNEPQVHSSGEDVWIDWIDGADLMRWTRREADGSWTQLEAEPFAGMEDREYHVRGRIKRAVREQ